MKIVDMKTLFEKALYEVTERWSSEVYSAFIAALDGEDVIGWCGLLPQNDGRVFEVHPLAVRGDWQRKGIGGKLLDEVTDIARKKGGLTLQLSASDEKAGGETSFANADLYDDLPNRINNFDPGTHQAAFYIKHGFKIIGVMPDQYGKGKPSIFFGKRLW
jgi:aminoglycoside 6'-N-acetyltransferase I